jgi:hypothetical protein
MSRPSFENLLLCILAYIDVCHDLPHLDGIGAGVLYHDLFASTGLNNKNDATAGDADLSTAWSLRMPPTILPSKECGVKWVVSGGFSPIPPDNLEVLRQQGQEEYAQTQLEVFLDVLLGCIASHRLHVFDFSDDNAVTVTKNRALPVQKDPLNFLSRTQLSHLAEEVLMGRLRLQRCIQPPANDPPPNSVDEDGEYDYGGGHREMRGTTFTVSSQRAKVRGLYKKPPPKLTAREQADLDRMRDRTSRLDNVSPALSSNGSCESLNELLASPLCTHAALLCDCSDCQNNKNSHVDNQPTNNGGTSVAKPAVLSQPHTTISTKQPPAVSRQQRAGTQHHRFIDFLRDGDGCRVSDGDTSDGEKEEPVFQSAHPTKVGANPPPPFVTSATRRVQPRVGDRAYRDFVSQINTITEESARRAASREPPHISEGNEPVMEVPVHVNLPSAAGDGPQTRGSQPPLAAPLAGPPASDGAPRPTSLTKKAPPPAPPGKKGIPRSGLYRKEMEAWEKEKEARNMKQGQCCIVM